MERPPARAASLQISVGSLQTVLRAGVFFYHGAMNTSPHYSIRYWRYVAGAWLAIALFDALQTVVSMKAMGMQHAWVTLFFVTVASWLPWAVLTPAILGLLRRFRLPSRELAPWSVHIAACVAVGATWGAWAALLEHATNPFAYARGAGPFPLLLTEKFLGNLVIDALLYGAIVAVGMTLDAHNRLLHQHATSARLAELLAQAQLAALRLQIEPHFIFNTLNAATGLIREKKDQEAIALIAAFGDLLRRVTERSERQFVSMAEEIEFARKYLDIQQLRFAERLRYRIDIPDDLMTAQVPDFIVQALVENAIKHGISKQIQGGLVRVIADFRGNNLELLVQNSGQLSETQNEEGFGIKSTQDRLNLMYQGKGVFEIRNLDATMVESKVVLPVII